RIARIAGLSPSSSGNAAVMPAVFYSGVEVGCRLFDSGRPRQLWRCPVSRFRVANLIWRARCVLPSHQGARMSMVRVGLMAVSGVRVYNERLKRLGVTLPGFVERARVIASMPSLGLLTLAGATPPEYHVTVLSPYSFDVVGISSFPAKADVMYAIADFYRGRGTTVVLGGLHCTLLPEEATEHADAVVAGEGEALWPGCWTTGSMEGSGRSTGTGRSGT